MDWGSWCQTRTDADVIPAQLSGFARIAAELSGFARIAPQFDRRLVVFRGGGAASLGVSDEYDGRQPIHLSSLVRVEALTVFGVSKPYRWAVHFCSKMCCSVFHPQPRVLLVMASVEPGFIDNWCHYLSILLHDCILHTPPPSWALRGAPRCDRVGNQAHVCRP